MKIKEMISMQFFVFNLNNYISYKGFPTVKKLADFLSIKYSRLISWLNFQKTPPLAVLDKIANKMQIYSKDLIGNKIDFNSYVFIDEIDNLSNVQFCINLRKYLNKYDIKTASDFVAYFEGNFSKHTYYSYFKNSNRKTPSLKSLETISSFLGVKPTQLIE